MPTDPGPFHIEKTRMVLTPEHEAVAKTITPDFFENLGDFTGHVLLSQFAFDEPWGVWEMHPAGDEIVYLLEGAVELRLRDAAGERRLELDEPGSYAVVPKGAWHTAFPKRPTSMLFITPGQGTENRDTPPV
ncbi:MAG: cupin domain-containing protein [Myxococcota bacterium]|nr:cupin domain-containing protein [Myxococcota bacterium]